MATTLKLRPPRISETELHQAVADALTVLVRPPAEWTTFPAGQVQLPPAAASKLHRLGLKRGWPDILLVHGGRFYGLEIKAADGRLSQTRWVRTKRGRLRLVEGQAAVHPRLERAGMRIAVVRSAEEAIFALADWGIPLRIASASRSGTSIGRRATG